MDWYTKNAPVRMKFLGTSREMWPEFALEDETTEDREEPINEEQNQKGERLERIVLQHSLTGIGSATFYFCKSRIDVTIPEGIARISDLMFNACGSLPSVTIPEGVTRIGENAFRGCGNLTVSVVQDSYAHNRCISNNVRYIFAGASRGS